MSPTTEVVLFTIVLALAGHPVLALLELGGGLFLEHLTAYNTGTGQPFGRFPLRRS